MTKSLVALILVALLGFAPRAVLAACTSGTFPTDAAIRTGVSAATTKTIAIGTANPTFHIPCRQDADFGTFTFAMENFAGLDGAEIVIKNPSWNGATAGVCYWVRVQRFTTETDCGFDNCNSSIINVQGLNRAPSVTTTCGLPNTHCDPDTTDYSGALMPGEVDRIEIDASGSQDLNWVTIVYDFDGTPTAGDIASAPSVDYTLYAGGTYRQYVHLERDQCR